MLAVDKNYRKRRIGRSSGMFLTGWLTNVLGSTLVKEIIRQMIIEGCDEVRALMHVIIVMICIGRLY